MIATGKGVGFDKGRRERSLQQWTAVTGAGTRLWRANDTVREEIGIEGSDFGDVGVETEIFQRLSGDITGQILIRDHSSAEDQGIDAGNRVNPVGEERYTRSRPRAGVVARDFDRVSDCLRVASVFGSGCSFVGGLCFVALVCVHTSP